MAASKEKVSFMSQLKEQELEGDDFDDHDNTMATGRGCCFGQFCFKWWQDKDNRHLLHDNEEDYKEPWWIEKAKKVKEASELLAGPKWKNFIRKVGKYCNIKKDKHNNQFQYDPESYALNFDRGFDWDDDGFAQ